MPKFCPPEQLIRGHAKRLPLQAPERLLDRAQRHGGGPATPDDLLPAPLTQPLDVEDAATLQRAKVLVDQRECPRVVFAMEQSPSPVSPLAVLVRSSIQSPRWLTLTRNVSKRSKA